MSLQGSAVAGGTVAPAPIAVVAISPVDFERRPFEGSRKEGKLSLEIEPKEARAKKRRAPFRPVRRIGFTRALSSNQAAKLGFLG